MDTRKIDASKIIPHPYLSLFLESPQNRGVMELRINTVPSHQSLTQEAPFNLTISVRNDRNDLISGEDLWRLGLTKWDVTKFIEKPQSVALILRQFAPRYSECPPDQLCYLWHIDSMQESVRMVLTIAKNPFSTE